MALFASATRYQSLKRSHGLLVLAVFTGFTGACLVVAPEIPPQLGNGNLPGDLALYTAAVQRIAAGENYYDALGGELSARGYPVRSVFNWRTPLHLELIARLPNLDWARMLLGLCGFCAIGLAVAETYRSGERLIAPLQFVAFGIPLALVTMPPAIFFGEVWAGVFMAIAVVCCSLGWRNTGAIMGVLALFFRELALPFVVISLFLAWRERRKTETWIWTIGLTCYALYFGLHLLAVWARIPPAGVASQMSRWLQFGGLRFVLITSRVGLLFAFQYWVAALYLPLAVLGMAGWRNPATNRVTVTVIAYIAGFCVIGMPLVNYYWGAIYTPLLAFGMPRALAAFRDLMRVVWEHREAAVSAMEGAS
jgi:hypothetical protein